jgi:plastocyanin
VALLRRVRDAGRGSRLSWSARSVFGLALLLVLAGGCRRDDPSLRPDDVLRDSLGLGDDDRVHRIRLSSPDNRETVEPGSIEVRPGDWVEFRTADRRVHAVSFVLDSLAPAAAEFLRASAQESSPPLVEPEARFLVSFADAPVGRYPFVVAGNGAEARGSIVVAEPSR